MDVLVSGQDNLVMANSSFRNWLEKQKHDKDPLNDLVELLQTELDKHDASMFANILVEYIGMTESTFDNEIDNSIAYDQAQMKMKIVLCSFHQTRKIMIQNNINIH